MGPITSPNEKGAHIETSRYQDAAPHHTGLLGIQKEVIQTMSRMSLAVLRFPDCST